MHQMHLVLLDTAIVRIGYSATYFSPIVEWGKIKKPSRQESALTGKSICKSMDIGFHFLLCVSKKTKKHSRWT